MTRFFHRLNTLPTKRWTLVFIAAQLLGILLGVMIGRANDLPFVRVYGVGAICWITAVLAVSLPRVLEGEE